MRKGMKQVHPTLLCRMGCLRIWVQRECREVYKNQEGRELAYSLRSSRSHKNPSLISSSLALFRLYRVNGLWTDVLVASDGQTVWIEIAIVSTYYSGRDKVYIRVAHLFQKFLCVAPRSCIRKGPFSTHPITGSVK